MDSREELKKCIDAMAQFDRGNPVMRQETKREQPKKKEEFIPTPEQEAKWSKEKITDNQKGYLGKLGYEGDPAELSKLEAFKLISLIEKEEGDPEDEKGMYL